VDAYTFTKQTENISTNVSLPESFWQLSPGAGQERNADGGIHTTRDHNNVRSVLQKAKKIA
jgi:hypothetical protein